jgi:hypothetical protein
MRVIHILKDGSEVEDITGRVVKVDDAGTLYSLIREINRKSGKKNRKLSASKKADLINEYLEVK